MERPILEIPGYYYDVAKKKYFKIQSGGAATSSSPYTTSDIKRRKIRDEASEAREALFLRQRGRIRKSKILQRVLAGGELDRSHGTHDRINSSQIYAEGLIEQGKLSPLTQFSICNDPLFDVEHRVDLDDGIVDIRMVFDDQIWTVRANTDNYKNSNAYGSVQMCHDEIPDINRGNSRLERFGHSGASTSLSTHQESRTTAFTWLSGVNHSGIAIVPMSGILRDSEPDRPTILLSAGGLHEVNVWSSTAAPNSSQDLFAFGTSDGIFTVDKVRCDPKTICPTLSDWSNAPKEVFALEYLADNPSILLSGTRSGILNIIDTRLPFSGTDIIIHPSSITHIKQLDSHRILVAGLASSLCQYDLRFRKSDTPAAHDPPASTHSKKSRSKHHHKVKTKSKRAPTRPILSYAEYKNDATRGIGLDVDVESGLIAAGQEGNDEIAQVELFSLHGGERLKTRVAQRCRFSSEEERMSNVSRCVKWVDDGYGRGKSLWVGMGKEVKRFTWGTWEDGMDDYDC